MRKLSIFLAIAAFSLPVFATHRVTVDQFHSWLAARKASSQSDNEIAKQIATLQLLERLSPSALAGLKTEFSPGPRTTEALDLLADCSAILDPPATELPSRPPPDTAALTAMIKATVHFVGTTMRQMPDFMATRITQSYDDNDPHVAKSMPDTTEDVNQIAPHNVMIPVGSFRRKAIQAKALRSAPGFLHQWRIWGNPFEGLGRRVKREAQLQPLGTNGIGDCRGVSLSGSPDRFPLRG